MVRKSDGNWWELFWINDQMVVFILHKSAQRKRYYAWGWTLCKMWISRILRKKPLLSFQGIISNTLFFDLKLKCFRFLSYIRTTYLGKHPVRFASIDPRGLDNGLLVPLLMIFIVIVYIGENVLYYCRCRSFSWILVIQLNYGHSKCDWSE
jgi:hypothetical protein